jgi:hypothetical protein
MSLRETSLNLSNASSSFLFDREDSKAPEKYKPKNGIELMKNYLLMKAENMYKLNFTDEEAFKWKFHKNKNNRPLSSFRLIKK